MKKNLSKLIAVLLSIVLLTSTIPAFGAYAVSSLVNNVSRTRWMGEIKDDTLLSDISIPGTHDSAARIVDTMTNTWAQTQSMTITDQLNAGVRFLDLRVRYNTDVYHNVEMCHSSITIWNGNGGHLTLYEVIGNVKDFLKNNPTETVICCIKEDDGSNESNIIKSINEIKAEDPSFWYQSYNTPKLGDVRGKMVVASRMSTMPGLYWGWGDQGFDGSYVQTYSNAIIQDRYNMGTTAKWNDAIVPTFNYAKKSGQWVINCLNTTGGGIAGVSANSGTINPAFGRYDLHNNKCYGIVLFDYINDDYTTKIIKCNDLVTKRQPNPENKEYYYRLNVNNPDSVPSGWSSCSLRLYYKANNGTGYEGSELLFQNGDTYNGYAFVCQTGNYEFSGKLSGYPTMVVFQYDWGYGSDRLELDFKLYVSKDPTSEYTQVMDTFFARTSGISSPQKGTDYFAVDSVYTPKPASAAFYNDSETTINVPQIGSDSVTSNTFNAKVYDQYGVRWFSDATSYRLSNSLNGAEFEGNTLKVNQYANDNPQNSESYVLASYEYGGKTVTTPQYKKVTLNTNKIPYTFVDLDGNTLATGEGYYGEQPVYNSTIGPAREPSASFHYAFASWSPSTISTSRNVFKPVYDVEQHTVSSTTTGPDATCTEDGYDTAHCSCGYSWRVVKSATGHDMQSIHVDNTCTELGFDKTYCTKCDYIESYQEYPAIGHDRDNAIKGDRVDATANQNSFIPFFCPNCGEEFEDMRQYSVNDYTAYDQTVKYYNDIINDPDYQSFDETAKLAFEQAVASALAVDEMESPYQNDIDNASSLILTAIDNLSKTMGINYYVVTFVKSDGTTTNTMYKEGTSANDILKPANSPYLVENDTHTVYNWQTIHDVTANASYTEIAVKSHHIYNTYIYPIIYVAPTCSEQGSKTYQCLCGHSYTEFEDEIGHSFVEYVPNNDGTHRVVCANDSNHYYVEDCDNNEEGICKLCGITLDYSLYNLAVTKANTCINSTSKYTAQSLSNLEDIMEQAANIISLSKSQKDIDNATQILLESINSLEEIEYNVDVYYILDYEIFDKVEKTVYSYGDSIDLSVPNGYNLYKTTIESDGKTTRFDSSEYIVNNDAEIIVYMFS